MFQARRGGVNVPTPTYIADITTAISSISEANDALGGTFATKSCQDLTCPAYTETAVQILAHCREYGNLNARTWPEKIAHENALTMAALCAHLGGIHARPDQGAVRQRHQRCHHPLGLVFYLVEAIVQARVRDQRPAPDAERTQVPGAPSVLGARHAGAGHHLRPRSTASATRSPSLRICARSGSTRCSTSTPRRRARRSFLTRHRRRLPSMRLPANVQWAIYPQSAFLGIDSGALELGIVRDSVLNSTNDFQVFGERFRNLALIGPAQAAYWVTTTYCAERPVPACRYGKDLPVTEARERGSDR